MELTKFNGMNPKGSAWNPSLEVLLTPTLQVVDNKDNATSTFYGKLKDNYRNNVNIEDKKGILFDFDKSPFPLIDLLMEAFEGSQAVIHTTYSHDPKHEKYCYRVFVNTSVPIKPEDYENVFLNLVDSNRILSELRDKGILDISAKDKGRFFYDWSCPPIEKLMLIVIH
jgi:hypothetical protein